MSIQIIKKDGKPEWAILPYADYLELLADHDDHKQIYRFKSKLLQNKEDLIPTELVNRIISGESPIRVYRGFRNLTLSELAKKSHLSVPYLSQLEHKEKTGGVDTLKNIASALSVNIDDLV